MSFTIKFQFVPLDDEFGRDMSKEDLRAFLLEPWNTIYARYVEYILQMLSLTDLNNRYTDNEDEYRQRVAQCITFNQDTLVATLTLPRKLWCADGPYYNEHFTRHMREFYVDELRDFVQNDINVRSEHQAGPSVCTHPSGAIVTVNVI